MNVRDRFGDYGIVGVIIFQVLSRSLIVDTFLLSCRAMGRGVEHQMLARLGTIAMDREADYVELPLVPTAKNQPADDFLESLVSTKDEVYNGGWRYQLPAKIAADCRWDPNRARLQNRKAVPAQPAIQQEPISLFSPQSKDDFLIDIATNLNDPKAIYDVISSDRMRPELAAPFVAPSSPIEKELTSIWSERLGFEQIGINDHFFDLGGHSLLAIQVLSRIRATFNVELSPRLLVTQEFTVAALSKAILVEQIQQSDTSEIEDILEKLDALSADELKDFSGIVGKK